MAGQPDSFDHIPVMADEITALLAPAPPGTYLDTTVGGGGHARAVLAAAPQLRLLGLDRDRRALDAAARALADLGGRVQLRHARFDALGEVVAAEAVEPITAVLFDLGVSSHQLDVAERGFSYRRTGPLDMRMDPDAGPTAADVVNTWTEQELTALLRDHADERHARRIARAVVAARPLSTTTELADVVRDAIPAPARRTGGHPAKRTFQALRIAVNAELDVLPVALDAAIELLAPGGRMAVLAYHSGEDRVVKQRFRAGATAECTCPPPLPCTCGAQPQLRLLTRGAQRPSEAEVAANPRAASARLRAAEKLAPGQAA